jgi:mannan endo-1,4-beta-mannosidase
MKSIVSRAELLTEMADKRGKVVAITETGVAGGIKKENNVNKEWFTTLLTALKESAEAGKNKAAYMLVWANFDMSQFWVPYMHHSIYGNNELLQDFVNFYNDDFTVFSDTIDGFYDLDVDTVPEKAYMYIYPIFMMELLLPDLMM